MVSKDDIRQDVWRRMTEAGVARFPWARGRIPNFEGAGQAQEQLASLEVWMDATTIKCSPDMPQRPLRRRALEEGKVVYMAVPRLTSAQCFLELDPSRFGDYVKASSIKGAFQVGRPVHPRDMRPIDLIVCGAVAVATGGARLGKGGGFSDLEYALARTLGLVNEDTPILTTVHPIQVLDDTIPMTRHDIPLDYVATSEGVIRCGGAYSRPKGIYWDEVGSKLEGVPILREMEQEWRVSQ